MKNKNYLGEVPIKSDFDNLTTRQSTEKWFNFWNEKFPVKDLRLEFYENDDNRTGGHANTEDKITKINDKNLDNRYWQCFHICRHEHVHQLLAEYGYDYEHTYLFYLVNSALHYAFDTALNKNPHFSISFYDFHQDRISNKKVNTRLLHLLVKRLSRYVSDPKVLIEKADEYASFIRRTIPRSIYTDYTRRKLVEQTHQKELKMVLDSMSNNLKDFEKHKADLNQHINELIVELGTLEEERDNYKNAGNRLSKNFKSLTTKFNWLKFGAIAYFVGSLLWIAR